MFPKVSPRVERLVRSSARRAGQKLIELTSEGGPALRPWDRQFLAWIAEAKAQGRDPNDIGDERWSDPRPAFERHYRPLFGEGSTVLELGPGTGRYTRHIVGKCNELIVVDYSRVVCEFMSEYLAGKGAHRVVHARDYGLTAIADASVDAIVANGVFEHLYLEAFHHYFKAFRRVLRPGARGAFNYNNLMSKEGYARFVAECPKGMDERSAFRFYHPAMVERLATEAGLDVISHETSDHRFAFFTFGRPR